LHHCIGDPRVQKTKIIWIEPALPWWVQNSSAEQKGELALEVTVEKDAAEENGDAWGVAMDVCIPVMHLIDITRSMPYSIQGVKHVFGISFAFNRITEVHVSSPLFLILKCLSCFTFCVILSAPYQGHWNGYKISSQRTPNNCRKQYDLHR
jgi:hypothetical protein